MAAGTGWGWLPNRQRPPEATSPARAAGASGSCWPAPGSGQQLLQQYGPADQAVAALADTGFHWQVKITGFVDQAADFAGRLGDVNQQDMPATVTSSLGMRDSSSCPWGRRVQSRAAPLNAMDKGTRAGRGATAGPHWGHRGDSKRLAACTILSRLEAPFSLLSNPIRSSAQRATGPREPKTGKFESPTSTSRAGR
jgi:hypothetical protein